MAHFFEKQTHQVVECRLQQEDLKKEIGIENTTQVSEIGQNNPKIGHCWSFCRQRQTMAGKPGTRFISFLQKQSRQVIENTRERPKSDKTKPLSY